MNNARQFFTASQKNIKIDFTAFSFTTFLRPSGFLKDASNNHCMVPKTT
jgi:hypothetical protein